MARIDKVVQLFRGTAGTALTGFLGVFVNSGGSVVPSGTPAATSGAVGVICEPGTIAAGHVIGVLVRGEIVELGGTSGGTYYAGAAGSISTTATNATKVGFSVEADRLVVVM